MYAAATSGYRELGQRPALRRVERQHDLIFGNACVVQLLHECDIRVIGLDPDLTTVDVNVGDNVMKTLNTLPSSVDQRVIIVRRIE